MPTFVDGDLTVKIEKNKLYAKVVDSDGRGVAAAHWDTTKWELFPYDVFTPRQQNFIRECVGE